MALNFWTLVKGLLVQNEVDRTKEISVEVDNAATTATRTSLKSAQTANRTLNLPDASDTLVGKQTVDVLENKTIDFSTGGNNVIVADAVDIIYDNGTSGLTAVDVQAAVDEVEAHVDTVEAALNAHLVDAVDAHDASAISNVPAGDLIATDVQGALNELQTDVNTRIAGPALATDNAIVRYDGTTGKLADDSQWTIDDGGELSPVADASQDLGNSAKRVAVIWGTELHSDASPLRLTTSGQQLILGVSSVDGGGASFSNIPQITVDASNDYGFRHDDGTVSVGSFVDGTYGYYGTESNHPLAFFTNNGSAQVVLNTSGDFGIAQAGVPNARLDVKAPLANHLIALTQAENDFFVRFKLPALAGSTSYTLPPADGTSGQILTTDGAGILTWSSAAASGANTSLSNLTSPTAVNQDLIPSGTRDLGSTANPWQSGYFSNSVGVYNGANPNIALLDSGFIVPSGGSVQGVLTNTPTQALALYTASATGSTGNLLLETGNGTVNSGNISLQTGTAGTTRGSILFNALTSDFTNAPLGSNLLPNTTDTRNLGSSSLRYSNVWTVTHNTNLTTIWNTGFSSPQGQITPNGYVTPSGATADLGFRSTIEGNEVGITTADGPTNNATATGTLLLETGNKLAGTGNSGDINIQTGTSSGGTRGNILFSAPSMIANVSTLRPSVTGGTLGTSAAHWRDLNVRDIFTFTTGGSDSTWIRGTGTTSPSGTSVDGALQKASGSTTPLAIYSPNKAGTGATVPILIETGNSTAGAFNSGDISLQTGTSSGGTRGSINFNALGANFANAPISSDLIPSGTRALGNTSSPWNRIDLNAGSTAGINFNSGTFHIGHGFSDSNDPFGGSSSSFIMRTTSSAASSDIEIYSANQSGASISGDIKAGSGNNTSSSGSTNSGGVTVRSGALTNAGNAGSSGSLIVATGNVAGTGPSGDLSLSTGTSGGTRGRIEMSASVIDHNQTVSEAVVWQSGATGSRPGTPVLGQRFFDTTLGIPIWYDGTNWVDATGTTV